MLHIYELIKSSRAISRVRTYLVSNVFDSPTVSAPTTGVTLTFDDGSRDNF
jgi:hypothetical protein